MASPLVQLLVYLLFDYGAVQGLHTSSIEWLEDNEEWMGQGRAPSSYDAIWVSMPVLAWRDEHYKPTSYAPHLNINHTLYINKQFNS